LKVELKRVDSDFHFEAVGSAGVTVNIDTVPSIGGHNAGARPMELMLMSLGSCSAIDVIEILKKQKQDIQGFNITIDGEREPDKIPSLFKEINIHYTLKGDIDERKVKRAIELSLDKYCSAAATLKKTSTIQYSYSIEK
jgi:putative redox protein